MGLRDRRYEKRVDQNLRFCPVECTLFVNGQSVNLEVINYHYRGACFRVAKNDYRVSDSSTYLKFRLGVKELPEKIKFRLVWETISENGCFGVEFYSESAFVLARAERFIAHSINVPVILSKDPIDPNRMIYFKVVNISTTGMLVSTSLTNKHLFPGMELKNANLEIPGMGKVEINLFIENSRVTADGKSVQFGLSVKSVNHSYIELISRYLSKLGAVSNPDERLDKLEVEKLIYKNLSAHLTIREVRDQSEYEKVLKLRYLGYKSAGKVNAQKTWREMGDGLDKEGIIIAGYLGGQLVASAEFRFLKTHGLKISEKVNLDAIPEIQSDNLSEINRLVVHPKAQHTDVVLGIFQKIHAIAMLNGRPDGVIWAEDKLVSLYERLGFHKLNYSYPHPTKINTNLNLMIIRGEAYAYSEGMNPYAWSVAFLETHKFLSEIGIQKASRFNIRQRLVKLITLITVKLFPKKKSKQKQRDASEAENQVVGDVRSTLRNIADPKWTKQHINATVLLPYILEAKDMTSDDFISKVLLEYGFSEEYFRSVSNWVSIDFFDDFIEKFSKQGDAHLLNKRAGYRSTSKEVLGANYFLMKHFLTPKIAFKAFERYLPKFNKTRVYRVLESSSSGCRIRITNPDKELIPKHASTKENWVAVIDAYVRTITGKPAKIEVVKSTFDGDEYCEYIVSWQNNLLNLKNLVLATSVLILTWNISSFVYRNFEAKEIVYFLSISLVTLLLLAALTGWKRYKKRYLEMVDSLSLFENDAEERYRELQSSKAILEKSYQEGKLLEGINTEIQKSENLTNILQTALDSICAQFEFKRSFAMIIDEEKKELRTAAVKGDESSISDVWNFKVDISAKRENPLVLSSVFFTGQSIMINNVEEHKFHLNEISRKLIEKLNTKAFAIVPIPSESRNWGVLIADKGQSGDIITRRDLVALQRVAQSIGLALDKKSKIDSEVKVRKIFQKFVPSAVVESTLGIQEPKLGGESREAICLFMDIRNFTSMSSQMLPQILCEMLNSIFDILQKTVADRGGIIDKFLGDGALVTWGAVPGSKADPNLALQMVSEFSIRLLEYNTTLLKRGLKPIEVGFGIHRGPVVAGNIGSNERMEFTVIGSTVNLASRLEQLTKVFKSQVVISESLIPFDKLDQNWKVHKNVHVRGLEGAINVASFNLQQIPFDKAGNV